METQESIGRSQLRLVKVILLALAIGFTIAGLPLLVDVPELQFLVLCGGMSFIIGLLWAGRQDQEKLHSSGSLLDAPLVLAQDRELIKRYKSLSDSLLRIRWRQDPIYRSVALVQLDDLAGRIQEISEGRITYLGTETWRLVYEQLLKSRGLVEYRSVSWIRTPEYWQDEPGRQSLRVNLQLHESGQVNIERIAILADELWPSDSEMPVERIRQWFHQQHSHGIWLRLVRESQLTSESELLGDLGIYGSRAVGFQTLDENARTVRFDLDFNLATVEKVEDRWNRLKVYSTSYADLLDHFPLDG